MKVELTFTKEVKFTIETDSLLTARNRASEINEALKFDFFKAEKAKETSDLHPTFQNIFDNFKPIKPC